MVPQRMTAKGCHRWEVMTRSSGIMPYSRPTETASCATTGELEDETTVYTRLSNGEMAEGTNELCPVEGVGATHGQHVLVHLEELVFLDLYLEGRRVVSVSAEGILVKLDGEGLGVVGDRVLQLLAEVVMVLANAG